MIDQTPTDQHQENLPRKGFRRRLGWIIVLIGAALAMAPSLISLYESNSLRLAVWITCDTESSPFTKSFSPNIQLHEVDEQWQAKLSFRAPGTRGAIPVGMCRYKYIEADHAFSVSIDGETLVAELRYKDSAPTQHWRLDVASVMDTDKDVVVKPQDGLLRWIGGYKALYLHAILDVDGRDNDPIAAGVRETLPVHVFANPRQIEFLSEVRELPVDFRLQAFRGEPRLVEYLHDNEGVLRARLQHGLLSVIFEFAVFVGGALVGLGTTLVAEAYIKNRRNRAKDQKMAAKKTAQRASPARMGDHDVVANDQIEEKK